MNDLFTAAGQPSGAPLAVRMRPRSLDEVLGQEHLLGPGSPLRQLTGATGPAGPVSVILWGPPGTGKTTLAQVISASSGGEFVQLSAISAGVKDVRVVMDRARDQRSLYQRQTVLFLDEIHRFSKAQQDALLPGVENGWVTLIAATTENPSFSVISPLLSRSLVLTLRPLDDQAIATLLQLALVAPQGLAGAVAPTEAALAQLIRQAGGDARRALTGLEAAAGAALAAAPQTQPAPLDQAQVEQAIAQALVRYDRGGDQHYDVTSALIKAIRGSDVDAALHYAARMLHAGEDPRFICRRLMISAAEDIGLADPQALTLAVAAAQAVQLIGMPEARIIVAEAVTYLATAPKSNAAYRALDAALTDVQAGRSGVVPAHLRDGHYPGATALGHGVNYVYAHDQPHGIAAQQYLPDALAGAQYYQPTDRGAEAELSLRLAKIRRILRGV